MPIVLDAPHVMVDLETLSTRPDAAIASIGAVFFTARGNHPVREFHANVDITSALAHGMSVDGDTLYWWMKQSTEARNALVDPHPEPLAQVIHRFDQFYRNAGVTPSGIWSHGAAFDLPILRFAFRLCNLACPWGHRQEFCYRTLKLLSENRVVLAEQPTDQQHNALFDARHQARNASNILRTFAPEDW